MGASITAVGEDARGATAPDPTAMLATLLGLAEPDSLVSRLTLQLARDIIEGRVEPGETVNSLELSKRFDTSRTPVREALFALEREGLLEIQARRRPRVVARSARQVAEIYGLRAELHALLAQAVAARIDPAGLDQIRGDLAALRAAVESADVDAYFWRNVAFHNRVAVLADNSTTKRMLDSLGLQVLRLRHLTMSLPGRMQVGLHDHERLVLAFEQGDVGLAGALSRSLVLNALRTLQALPAKDFASGY